MNYSTKQFIAKGNKYSVLIASGNNPYISVTKETNNPFKTIGKQFNDFNDAQEHYKCAEIKTQLLLIETGIN